MRVRVGIVVLVLAMVAASHWLTPTGSGFLHAVHLTLRKLFFLPVIFGAVWFGLRGSVIVAAAATALYVPHVLYQWTGQLSENLNQGGELASVWVVAVLAGVLVGKEREIQQRLLDSHQGALSALVTALDARESATERHSLRVAAFAERLGREMGLEQQDLEDLKIGALLHDIGKIGIRDEVLLADGPLDMEAETSMRRHPEIGLSILDPILVDQAVCDVVYCHHERYDGLGYPQALEGPRIPLVARIFSVVDAFDAMTADRPYRPALPAEQARQVIADEKGRQFDPQVVEAFLSVPVGEWADLANLALLPHRSWGEADRARATGAAPRDR